MPVRLQERDQRILEHTRRYRITTPETLFRLFYEPEGLSDQAMKSTLKRLLAADCLSSEKLYATGNQVYYRLGEEGAAAVSAPSTHVAAVSNDSDLGRFYGVLLFCCHGERLRPRFTMEEFNAAFPGLRTSTTEFEHRFPHDSYYLDVDAQGERRLGRIIVDSGGRNQLKRLRDAHDKTMLAMPDLVRERRFALALVTGTNKAATDLRHVIRTNPVTSDYALRVVVEHFDALTPLLVPRPVTAQSA